MKCKDLQLLGYVHFTRTWYQYGTEKHRTPRIFFVVSMTMSCFAKRHVLDPFLTLPCIESLQYSSHIPSMSCFPDEPLHGLVTPTVAALEVGDKLDAGRDRWDQIPHCHMVFQFWLG